MDLDLLDLKRRFARLLVGRNPEPDPSEPKSMLEALRIIARNTGGGRPLGGS